MDNKENVITTECLSDIFSKNEAKLNAHFATNREQMLADLVLHLNALCAIANWQQNEGTKSQISYLHIAYLRSSILSGSYDFRLSMLTDKFWLDSTETAVYWKHDFAFMYVSSDIDEMSNRLREKHRLLEFEVDELRYKYALLYLPKALDSIKDLMPDAISKSDMATLSLNPDYSIILGGHMEESTVISPLEQAALEVDTL